MSTKIFTNQDANTLLNKFKGIGEHMRGIHHFDALVGYLYASGYFIIRPFLQHIPQIRILVGIETDQLVKKYHARGLEFLGNAQDTRDAFLDQLKADIQTGHYSQKVEEGVLQLVEDIITERVKIKAHPAKKIHSKVYIFRPEIYNEHTQGAVITGSSNLTRPGLETNLEFNVELRDYAEVKFATDTFEQLWGEAVDILPASVQHVKRDTYLNNDRTPFEIYIKLLIAYFGNMADYDPSVLDDLPSQYDKLAYQADAIKEGYQRLLKHRGFILADVVGLGKTVVATAIIKKYVHFNGFQTKVLVVHPPALRDNWENTINDFGLNDYVHLITNGSLHKVIDPLDANYLNAQQYDMVVVDESHKFRSDTSRMYLWLQLICKTPRNKRGSDPDTSKKVMLLSATPLNNRPEDIANQLYLFQNARQSTIEAVPNLQAFFTPLIREYKALKKDENLDQDKLRGIYDQIKERVLRPLVIRRTRNDILNNEMYAQDMEAQGVKFPATPDPTPLEYQFAPATAILFAQTIERLTDATQGLGYFRYQAIAYLKSEEHRELYDNASRISTQLAHIMKTLLIKRLESSFEAFRATLGRFAQRNQAMIGMFERDKVYIAPDLDVNRYLDEDREDELEELIAALNADSPNNQVLRAKDFEAEFLPGLQADQQILNELCSQWDKVSQDPKLERFMTALKQELLDKKRNLEGKLVIFTESNETAQYLYQALQQAGYSRSLAVNSGNQRQVFEQIKANFDAKLPKAQQQDSLDFIITTDVLAEGINLHRANVIVNYDVPWNSTRLMQRIGRVNRLGTEAAQIWVYNFFPTSDADASIDLQNTALKKLQGFHTAFGEDSKVYSPEEVLEENILNQISEQEANEDDAYLKYLSFLRKFKSAQPKVFKRIARLPLRSRTGRSLRQLSLNNGQTSPLPCTIAYLKSSQRSSFFIHDSHTPPRELTFGEALQIFEADTNEPSIELIAEHYAHVQAMETEFQQQVIRQEMPRLSQDQLSPQENSANNMLSTLIKNAPLDAETKDLAKAAQAVVFMGIFKKFAHELHRLNRKRKDKKRKMKLPEVIKEFKQITDKYPVAQLKQWQDDQTKAQELAEQHARRETPRIIISESFG